MPAAPSSLTDPAIGQLLTLAQAAGTYPKRLLPVLAAVPDPRARRGVRHRLAVILGLAACAVLAGARSFTAIAEWAADADRSTLEALGITGVVPCESTFRRTLQNLDADALDKAAGAWAQQRTAAAPARHLLAALDHAHGVVLGQVDVGAKTNEIPMFAALLDRIDLAGAVVTADVLHAQRAHAEYLAGQRGAHYLITVKGNQPSLRAQLAGLPWRQIPAAHDTREKGHGRAERRTLKITAVAAGLAFPGQQFQRIGRVQVIEGLQRGLEVLPQLVAQPLDLPGPFPDQCLTGPCHHLDRPRPGCRPPPRAADGNRRRWPGVSAEAQPRGGPPNARRATARRTHRSRWLDPRRLSGTRSVSCQ
jgi:hypothetical protein